MAPLLRTELIPLVNGPYLTLPSEPSPCTMLRDMGPGTDMHTGAIAGMVTGIPSGMVTGVNASVITLKTL